VTPNNAKDVPLKRPPRPSALSMDESPSYNILSMTEFDTGRNAYPKGLYMNWVNPPAW
jgi:hypothetical protein